jgi:hypothetical protein
MKSFELGRWRKAVLGIYVVFVHSLVPVFSQQFSVNTDELWPLVDEWNFAHQQKSVESLRRLYSDSVNYFGKYQSKESLLLVKKKFFQSHPHFTQTIENPVNYVAYSSGVVMADFILASKSRKSSSQSSRAYLILSYDEGKYKIAGEGDSLSQVKNGFDLALGEPLKFDPDTDESHDSSMLKKITIYQPKQMLSHLSSSIFFSEELIQISVRDVVIISSTLLITFVSLIISLARAKRKARNGSKQIKKSNGEANRIEQQAFQRFVVSLFDPLYFSLITSGHSNAHNYNGIDLEFQFRKQDVKAFVALRCLYLRERMNVSIKLLPSQSIQHLQQLEQTSGETEFYLVVGIGGKSEDPAETYLVPIHALAGENISYSQLQQYRKFGMFFYNAKEGQLK